MGPIEERILNEINEEEYYNKLKSSCDSNRIHASSLYQFQDVTDNFAFSSKVQKEYKRIMEENKRRVEQEQKKRDEEEKRRAAIAAEKARKEEERKEKENNKKVKKELVEIINPEELERNIISSWNTLLNSNSFSISIRKLIKYLNILFYTYRSDNFNILFNRFIKDKELIMKKILPDDVDTVNDLYNQLNKEYLNIEKIETILETCKKYAEPGYGRGRNVYNEYWTYGITYSAINTDIYIGINDNDVTLLLEVRGKAQEKERLHLAYDKNENLYFKDFHTYNVKNSKILDSISLDYLIERM